MMMVSINLTDQIAEHLRKRLANGPVDSRTIKTELEAQGFKSNAVQRTASKIGIVSVSTPGPTNARMWRLPTDEDTYLWK